jgi:hypothetical protein
MSRLSKRLGASVAMAATFGLVAATTASAHDCYNASRSDQGNSMAGSHSKAWFTLVITESIADDVAHGLYTAEEGACVYAAYIAAGGPASVTIHTTPAAGVIGDKNPNEELYTNGRGLDHFFEAFGGVIFGAFEQCGVEPPF